MSAQPRKPRRGDLLEVEWTELDDRASHRAVRGTAQWGGLAYDCAARRGVPQARARVRVLRRRGAQLDVRPLEELRPSPAAVVPRCAHFGLCGGCSYQDTDYARQLESKREFVRRALRVAGLGAPAELVEPTLGCEPPWGYRNKMDFSFANRRWVEPHEPPGSDRSLALGLHPTLRYDRVFDLRECAIAFPQAAAIAVQARALAREQGLDAWDVRAHGGLLRHLVLRRSEHSNEILADLVTSQAAPVEVERFARALVERCGTIDTLVQHFHDHPSQIAGAGPERLWHGRGWIEERLLGLRLRLSAQSFFQVNTRQAERLVALVRERAGSGRICWDLYSGAGTLALCLADRFESLWGVEQVAAAIEDARVNAVQNGIGNVQFDCADVAGALESPRRGVPDVLVVDPPRAGLHPRVAAALGPLAGRGTARLVYVSCNPRSAARDLALLSQSGWTLASARPVDLFPHTPHVECVFELRPGACDRLAP